MSTIITPNTAIFKEGEVYVIQLPEEPKHSSYSGGDASLYESCAYDKAVSYARAHPIKVHEKDKEKVKHKIMFGESPKGYNWVPQDLTEYRIEGIKLKVECIEKGHNEIYANEGILCSCQKVACLIKDEEKQKEMSDSDKLNKLAKWFDLHDWRFGNKGNEVQKDLRRIALLLKKVELPSEEGKEIKHLLSELLAVLHADGGHYESKHGTKLAIEDACKKYYSLHTKIDELESKLEKSDQEALAKAWEDGFQDSFNFHIYKTEKPKNPYTKD